MLDAIKPLLNSDLVNEETRQEIEQAWDEKLTETRNEVKAELREEFARRYEHDKSVMVEALDKMVTETLASEVAALQEERKAVSADRVKTLEQMKKSAGVFEQFMTESLAKEIKELRQDRKAQFENVAKLENFVMENLAEEIQEFAQDKKAVVETRVKLVAEAKEKLEQIKKDFIKKSASLVEQAVSKKLNHELTQLKEDIEEAKKNNFGRKIFESFAAEFSTSYLNENVEIKKLMSRLEESEQKLVEAEVKITETQSLVKGKQKELAVVKESVAREKKMSKLLESLNKEKASVMQDLLENVATDKLEATFKKYLPAVLSERKVSVEKTLTESKKEVTGNKETAVKTDEQGNIIDIKRLAGLKY